MEVEGGGEAERLEAKEVDEHECTTEEEGQSDSRKRRSMNMNVLLRKRGRATRS